MSRKRKVSWIFSLLLCLSLQGLVLASDSDTRQEPRITRDLSSVGATDEGHGSRPQLRSPAKQILSDAKDRASLIFRKAGVEVEWADCPLNDEDPSSYPECPAVVDATQLFLRIFPKTAAKMEDGGQAFVAARIANIFWNRVEERAQRLNVSAPRVTGTHHSPRVGPFTAWLELSFTRRNHDRALGRANRDSHLSGRLVFQQPTIGTHSIRNEKRKDQLRIVENALLIPQR